MKFSPLFLLLALGSWAQKGNVLPSHIDHVTVFTSAAEVERSARYTTKAGTDFLVVENVSPNVMPETITLEATGEVTILDTKFEVYYPENQFHLQQMTPKVRLRMKLLTDSISMISDQINQLNDEYNVWSAELNLLRKLPIMNGQGKAADSIEFISSFMKYYRDKAMEISDLMRKNRTNKEKKDKLLAEVNQRLRDLQQHMGQDPKEHVGPIYRIVITTVAEASTSGRVKLSYLVSNASWSPLYDIKATNASTTLQLLYKAKVRQNTGVNWEGVKLTLSTNDPMANRTPPTLAPWYIDQPVYNQNYGYRQPQSNKKAESAPTMAETNAYSGAIDMSDDAMPQANYSFEFTQIRQGLASMEFDIDLNYDIQTDNKEHVIMVDSRSVKSDRIHMAIPSKSSHTYMIARTTELNVMELIPGPANIFSDGSFIGKTYLDPTQDQDTLEIGLGVDPLVLVKRTLVKTNSKEKLVGNEHVIDRNYKYTVLNKHRGSVDLVVKDLVPLARNEKVKITVEDLSRGKLNDLTGLVVWDKKIRGGDKEDWDLKYQIKADKSVAISLAANGR